LLADSAGVPIMSIDRSPDRCVEPEGGRWVAIAPARGAL